MRSDIQGLRAISIVLVFGYHLFPLAIPGGFVGVDIFFVISGYLITKHLFGEYSNTGTIKISRFFARRIRRLLPTSFVVLIVSIFSIILFLPITEWVRNSLDSSAAAIYSVNWLLAFSSTGYANLGTSPSIVQQFWSLAVEEQFYLFWPLLLLALLRYSTKFGHLRNYPARPIGLTITAIAFVGICSLWFSIWAGFSFQAESYFFTISRIWEFAAGALLALIPSQIKEVKRSRTTKTLVILASWGASISIVLSALLINDSMPFPGYVALWPVLSVLYLLWAGDSGTSWEPAHLSKFGPVLAIGGLSYAIYLWHWPVLVIYTSLTGKLVSVKAAIFLILLTLLLSIFTKYLIENPFRFGKIIASTRRSLLFALIGSIVIAGCGLSISFWTTQQIENSSRTPAFENYAELRNRMELDFSNNSWGANSKFAPKKLSRVWSSDNCLNVTKDEDIARCTYGPSESEHVLVVLGDSFAGSYMPGLVEGFTKKGWKVIPLTLEQCPAAFIRVSTFNSLGQEYGACSAQQEWALSKVENISPERIVITNGTSLTEGRLLSGNLGQDFQNEWETGLTTYLEKLNDLGLNVTLLAQSTSHNCSIGTLPQDCLEGDPLENYSTIEKRATQSTSTKYVDSRPWFCNSSFTICPEMISGTYVLGDPWHLSDGYSMRLANILFDSITR